MSACGEPATAFFDFDGTALDTSPFPDVTHAETEVAPDVESTTEVVDIADSAETAPEDVAVDCDACALGCCEGRCCVVDPSQENLTDLGNGTLDLVSNEDFSFHTSNDCTPTSALGVCSHERVNDALDIVMCVCRVRSLELGHTLTVVGPDGLVILATDHITVSGTIDLSARGTTDGPGGGWAYLDPATERNGGWGGSFGTYGGSSDVGAGNVLLEPISGGMRGQDTDPGSGGGRGGSLQLSAGRVISVTGTIHANGGGGRGGINGGGGGGSGGGILIEAPEPRIAAAHIYANGGAGGGGGGPTGKGDDGEDGRGDRAARGGQGNDGADCGLGPVVGGNGGDGGYGFSDPREISLPVTSACEPEAWVAGGGAGGAIGRVVVRFKNMCDCNGDIVPAVTGAEIRVR